MGLCKDYYQGWTYTTVTYSNDGKLDTLTGLNGAVYQIYTEDEFEQLLTQAYYDLE